MQPGLQRNITVDSLIDSLDYVEIAQINDNGEESIVRRNSSGLLTLEIEQFKVKAIRPLRSA